MGKVKALKGNRLWQGRLGLIPPSVPTHIWIHAASVGEVRVIGYLINYLKERKPDIKIHITTMTTTGFNTALRFYASPNVTFSYFPIDAKKAIKRTVDAIAPKILVIAETEIWPVLVDEMSQRGIPVVIINARMSPQAFRKYKLARNFFKKVLEKYDYFFFKTEQDFNRYLYFGIKRSKASIVGDMKFDAPLVKYSPEEIIQIKKEYILEKKTFLFVAGSTRPDEEAIMAKVFKRLLTEKIPITMVIAPRHLERMEEVKSLLDNSGLAYRMIDDPDNGARVVLVNRMGILNRLYAIANLSFVGGTLADIGGHNLLEPVWAKCPVVFGPSVYNVKEAADYIVKNKYGAMVNSEEKLFSVIKRVYSGKVIYNTKTENELEKSPTATIGEYLLKKLNDA
ncbi:MAG: hypothetical protein GXO93_04455 [FCB group bacterium]|nr:hypothetical protein [FCB group bacterium]